MLVAFVIPGRAISAFTLVFDALWREPGIQILDVPE
jgi:hypothetical protein